MTYVEDLRIGDRVTTAAGPGEVVTATIRHGERVSVRVRLDIPADAPAPGPLRGLTEGADGRDWRGGPHYWVLQRTVGMAL